MTDISRQISTLRGCRFIYHAAHFGEKICGGKWAGEDFKHRDCGAVAETFVIEVAVDDEDGKAVAFGAEVNSGVVPGERVDIGADDEQIGFTFTKAVDGGTEISGGHNKVARVFECISQHGHDDRIGAEQQDYFADAVAHSRFPGLKSSASAE
jgi:hypothetical protein